MRRVIRGELWAVRKVSANIVVKSSEEALARGNAYKDVDVFPMKRRVETHVAGRGKFAMHVKNAFVRFPGLGFGAHLKKTCSMHAGITNHAWH